METAKVLINTLNMSREQWLEQRKKGIGGSDASIICGVNKYKSPINLFLDKTGLIPSEDKESESAYWGTVMEPVLRKEFELRTGLKVKRRNAILQHPKYDFILANVDGVIVGKRQGLEIKTASEYLKDEWLDEEVPQQYLIQCQHYMAVTGYEGWWICALVGGNKFIYKYIPRDEELINLVVDLEVAFWNNHIVPKVAPIVDGTEASSELIKNMFKNVIDGSEILLEDNAADLIAQIDDCKVQIKSLELRQSEAENKLKQALGENEKGIINGQTRYMVTWSGYSSKRIDSEKLKTERPDIYESYCKESKTRKFSYKQLKDKK